MKWKTKKTIWVFLYIKYSKFWIVSLEHFVEHKLLISEAWPSCYIGSQSISWWNRFLRHLVVRQLMRVKTNIVLSFMMFFRLGRVHTIFHEKNSTKRLSLLDFNLEFDQNCSNLFKVVQICSKSFKFIQTHKKARFIWSAKFSKSSAFAYFSMLK